MSAGLGQSVALEKAVAAFGAELYRAMPSPRGLSRARADRYLDQILASDPQLRTALFRFIDVRPACRTPAESAGHLRELLGDARESARAQHASTMIHSRAFDRPVAAMANGAVRHSARRFIVGETIGDATAVISRLWRDGAASTVDLLGEATVTAAEADLYACRCEQALRVLAVRAPSWAARPLLDADGSGEIARANLSVKLSALTPELRPLAPERGVESARERLAGLLRVARDLNAHLHVDMESLDTRDTTRALVCSLLAEEEFSAGPSCGVVLQAYLVDAHEELEELLAWSRSHPRSHPLTVRVVKGAYWDHEVITAAQHGWPAPVFTDRRSCDRNFELLTRRLLDEIPLVRVAIASHNLRSISHAAAYTRALELDRREVEFQVLRGLGDNIQAALVATGWRVRCYCPVGDLVAGMAYLVRRLLENTANDTFLAAHARGADLQTLLASP